MLATIGFITVFLTLILMLSKKLSPTATLVIVPAVACLVAGLTGNLVFAEEVNGFKDLFGATISSLSSFTVSGVTSVAATTVMFMFAMVFFNSMMDAGAFDPIINAAIKFAGDDPVKITIATVILAYIGHLDGNGITTTIITCSAMLPIYRKMHMKQINLIILCAISQGLMNICPWGGPTLRVMTAYEASMSEVFNPLIIPMIAGTIMILIIAVMMGRADAKRIASMTETERNAEIDKSEVQGMDRDDNLKRPRLVVFNLILIVFTLTAMVLEWLAPCPAMMFAAILGLIVNYPDPQTQTKLISKYGSLCMNMATIMFAAGVFTGVLKNSGMLEAMATTLAASIPASIGVLTPIIVGILGVPASLIFTPDAWYYSILPTLTTAVAGAGVDALSVARASLLGQMTLGFPGSPLLAGSFLLPAMINMDFPDYQKKWLPYAWSVSLVMIVVALITGCVTL